MQNPRVMAYDEHRRGVVSWIDLYLGRLTDDDLREEIAPGRNHGIWLLAHLIASDDDLAIYLGRGAELFPEYQGVYSQGRPLVPVHECPPVALLREQWRQVCAKNNELLGDMRDMELDEPHCRLQGAAEDDVFKTKGGCILNWTLHQQYHCGQLGVLLGQRGKRLI